MREIIRLNQVDKVYPPEQYALRDIDIGIKQGEFVFIAGASGAGKSTLLKLLYAEQRSTSGEVIIGGRNLVRVSRKEIFALRRNIGIIFQDHKLITTRTVLENVAFALEVIGIKRRERLKLSQQMLDTVGLVKRLDALPPTLSGGEQQRVSIARALINCPSLILADEPTGNLDPDMTRAIFKLLLEANRCGATVVIASHNLALIKELDKRTLVLDQGQLVGDYASPKRLGDV